MCDGRKRINAVDFRNTAHGREVRLWLWNWKQCADSCTNAPVILRLS